MLLTEKAKRIIVLYITLFTRPLTKKPHVFIMQNIAKRTRSIIRTMLKHMILITMRFIKNIIELLASSGVKTTKKNYAYMRKRVERKELLDIIWTMLGAVH